jgi:hypothetical protein
MTLYPARETVRPHWPALAQCPACDSFDLALPPAPRGDDTVKCTTCLRWFTYAAVEQHALLSARKRLAERFPQIPFGAA